MERYGIFTLRKTNWGNWIFKEEISWDCKGKCWYSIKRIQSPWKII